MIQRYEKVHGIVKYPTPNQITKYNHAILLYKTYNDPEESKDWLDLYFNHNFNERYTKANFFDTSRYKPGKNHLANRFTVIKNKIPYNWLNLPLIYYKKLYKQEFYA